jgi:glutamine amidotransferase
MTVIVVDYGAGNLKSAVKALEAAGGRDIDILATADPDRLRRADRVVLPGVGAFADCKRGLESQPGLIEALRETVIDHGRPFLGICVGMQLMATLGIEYGEHPGLDWIQGRVERLAPNGPNLKIPQIGWNDLEITVPAHPVLSNLPANPHAYFVHPTISSPRGNPTCWRGSITAGR